LSNRKTDRLSGGPSALYIAERFTQSITSTSFELALVLPHVGERPARSETSAVMRKYPHGDPNRLWSLYEGDRPRRTIARQPSRPV